MIGFLIGAVCLIGLVKTIRYGRGGGCHGGGYGHSHRGWGGHSHRSHGHGGWRGGGGARFFLRGLFERLDTSPGQEKAIVASLEQLWERKRALGDEFIQSRKDVARAMKGERFDEAALGEAFGRQDALLAQLRESVTQAMKSVHEALDDRQRKIAGDLLEGGGGFGRWGGGGPYRGQWE